MKAAVISDVHGNLPALESVMADIRRRGVDRILCLGDIIGKGPDAKETIDICRKECDIIVKGNWDLGLYTDYIALRQGNAGKLSEKALWYINSVDPQQIEYLGSLPHSTEFYLSGKLVRLFHAHPQSYNRYHADSPLEKRLELFGCGEHSEREEMADVAVYADIHSAYLQILEGRYLLNVGSVGNPLDMTQASYVILEGADGGDSSLSIQFVRVPYDIEEAVRRAIEAGVPDLDGYISELRTAVYFRRG